MTEPLSTGSVPAVRPSGIVQEPHAHHFPNGSIGVVGSSGDEFQGPCRMKRRVRLWGACWPHGGRPAPTLPCGCPGLLRRPGPGRGGALQTPFGKGVCWGWHPTPHAVPLPRPTRPFLGPELCQHLAAPSPEPGPTPHTEVGVGRFSPRNYFPRCASRHLAICCVLSLSLPLISPLSLWVSIRGPSSHCPGALCPGGCWAHFPHPSGRGRLLEASSDSP